MSIFVRVLWNALGLLVIANFVPGIVVGGVYPAVVAALILGILNAIVRPILFILTLPITILTLGLFSFLINAWLFLFAASFIEGFSVDGLLSALLGSLLMSIVNALGSRLI